MNVSRPVWNVSLGFTACKRWKVGGVWVEVCWSGSPLDARACVYERVCECVFVSVCVCLVRKRALWMITDVMAYAFYVLFKVWKSKQITILHSKKRERERKKKRRLCRGQLKLAFNNKPRPSSNASYTVVFLCRAWLSWHQCIRNVLLVRKKCLSEESPPLHC